ncbi:Gfo/Idh/MocA family protein [Amycolatopsis aidingensis]|uniref:Gfo/Idh/MocA family protein n=1 Tax=Amycolatopsis aidingensis TaxID=2842453 RepID=UPI001C0E330A|nr:Gfo/Idh/MocA family oxidoreductase [Amycolatopsis aidingensis]
MSPRPPSTVLVGTGGYGLRHLRRLLDLHRDHRIDLVGLVDVAVTDQAKQLVSRYACFPTWHPSIEDALSAAPVDSVVIATPPHTHVDLARTAILAGTAVYLEKPPVTLLQDLDTLSGLRGRRRVEVGFQEARATVDALERAWVAMDQPRVDRVVAHGALSRPDEYYRRSRWAGEWFLDGRAVLDGPLFNPLAHVVQAALLFAGRVQEGWSPAAVEAECFRARPLGGDDTSAIRITPPRGPQVLAVGTTATDIIVPPGVAVHTSSGVVHVGNGGQRIIAFRDGARVPVTPAAGTAPALHATVTDPQGAPDPLLSLESTRHFVLTVNAAVQAAGSPVAAPVPARSATRDGRTVTRVGNLGRLVAACARRGALLSEADPAWGGAVHRLDTTGYRGLTHPELGSSPDRGLRTGQGVT